MIEFRKAAQETSELHHPWFDKTLSGEYGKSPLKILIILSSITEVLMVLLLLMLALYTCKRTSSHINVPIT